MTPEQERWAEALAVECRYGGHAHVPVAERVGSLVLAGDEPGVRRWREIAACLDRLALTGARQ